MLPRIYPSWLDLIGCTYQCLVLFFILHMSKGKIKNSTGNLGFFALSLVKLEININYALCLEAPVEEVGVLNISLQAHE